MRRTGNRRRSKRKYEHITKIIAVVMMAIAFSSGCGTNINAGTAASENTANTFSKFDTQTQITWFNGTENKQASVTVSKPILYDQMPDNKLIPESKLCSYYYVSITSTNDITDLTNVSAVDNYGSPIVFNGKTFDGAGYPDGKNGYIFLIPNGIKDFAISAGNTIFQEGN